MVADSLQVSRIYARTISAKMVERQFFGNWAN
mgnify:CR=1 FL=1